MHYNPSSTVGLFLFEILDFVIFAFDRASGTALSVTRHRSRDFQTARIRAGLFELDPVRDKQLLLLQWNPTVEGTVVPESDNGTVLSFIGVHDSALPLNSRSNT